VTRALRFEGKLKQQLEVHRPLVEGLAVKALSERVEPLTPALDAVDGWGRQEVYERYNDGHGETA